VLAAADGVLRGAYVLAEASGGAPAVILIGTGSEVQLCLSAREALQAQGVPTRVVSMPCQEWFAAQDEEYRAAVLPPSVNARVSVEAGVTLAWHHLVGDTGVSVGLDRYGASAPSEVAFEKLGFTTDRVVAAARQALSRSGDQRGAA
jgi:transketolase